MFCAHRTTRLVASAASAFLISAASFAQTPPRHPPVEAFGTLPEVSQPSMSPDGKHVATIQVYNGRPIARIFTLDPPGMPSVSLPIDEGYIIGVQWANNDRLMITLNVNQQVYGGKVDSWYRAVSVDTNGQNAVMMFSDRRRSRDVNGNAAMISDLDADDPAHVYMPLYNDFSHGKNLSESMSDILYSMFRVEVATGNSELVLRGGMDTQSWIMDGHGHVVGRVDQTKDPLLDHLKLYTENGSWKEVESAEAGAGRGLQVLGLTEDGSALVLTSVDSQTGTLGIVGRSLSDGSKKMLFSDPNYDVGSVISDPWTSRVIGVRVTQDQVKDIYLDPKFKALQNGLEAVFPGVSAHAVSWDLSQQKVIVAVEGPQMPPVYYYLDRAVHSASPIRKTYTGLVQTDLGNVKPYPYKARDGLDIPAYLTLPPGKDPKNLPVVVLPHGGPMARDALSFDFEVQFLANRGYAVLQPNFRGSAGYGVKFKEAGYGEWGLKMQDDITDGVQKLIADGVADPKRICIVGGSYGGYAALAGAAFTPDLYACAASWAGVFDLRHFLTTRSQDYGKDSEMILSWTKFIGNRWDDSGKLDAASPAKNADKIKCPVLLMHGTDDTTVRIDQSQAMERALRRAGKNVTFIEIPKETHYMETSATRIRWLSEMEKFLAANIGT